jgi:uncharacterized protein (DUF4415 family)
MTAKAGVSLRLDAAVVEEVRAAGSGWPGSKFATMADYIPIR